MKRNKKKGKNKKGFTLIEILAAVTILAIISGIAVISVNRYAISTKKKLYQNMEKSVCDAAKNYVMTESLEDEVKESLEKGVTIEAKDLMKAKYLEDLVDPNNKSVSCRANVNVKLNNKSADGEGLIEYVYYVKLRCKGYESNTGFAEGCSASKKVTDPGSPEPSEDVDDPNTEPDVDTTKKPTCEIIKDNQDAEWTTGPIEAEVRCIDHSTKGCKQEFYTKTFTEDAKLGYIEMEDNAGNKADCKVNVYIDNNAPTKPKLNSVYLDKWTNKSFSIEIDTYDAGSGVAYIEYRYPNSTSAGEKEWKKYENSSRDSSETTKKFLTPKFSKERAEKVEFRACDNIGNCSDIASTNIKIDKTAPSCAMAKNIASPNGTNDWYKTAVNVTMTRQDPVGISDRAVASPISYGMATNSTITYNDKYNVTQRDTAGVTWHGFIKDEAGNSATCSLDKFKVDATVPTIGNPSNSNNGVWIGKAAADSGSYKVTLTGSDSMSGIAYYQYRYPNSTVSGENQWTTYASSNKSPFTTTAFSRQRNEKVEFRICDNAGLCSAPVSTMIQIDREAPTCVSSGGSNSWRQSVTLIGTCSDTGGSGCKENASKKFTTPGTLTGQTPGTVYDNAGNSTACSADQTVMIDTTKPTCTLQVDASGVSFKTKSDDKKLVAYGMGKSATPSYNGTTSLGLSTGTFYGYVKDEAGNEGKCSATITNTYVTSYSKKTTTCNRSISSYDCRKSAGIEYYCPSGYSDNGSQCYYTTNANSKTTWTKISMYCKQSSSTSYGTVHQCSGRRKSNCSGRCKWVSKGSNSSCVGNPSNIYCDSGYTYSGGKCKKTTYSYDWTNRSTSTVSSCSDNVFNCVSGNGGRTYVACTNKNTTYSCSSGSRSGTLCYHYSSYNSRYTCSSGTLSGSYCYQYNQTYCSGGFSQYDTNYSYSTSSSTTTVTTCNVGSSFSCNSLNYGKSYVASCTANGYACAKGTTKINNSYCYKVN